MSEEVSSSTATSGKHPRKEEDGETEEVSQAKRQRLDEDGESGPCTSSTSEVAVSEGAGGEGVSGSGEGVSRSSEGVTSESDEEYQVGGSESDGDLSSTGKDGDSSDISAEEEEVEEEEEEGGGSNIIKGQGVELREIKDGKYRLYLQQSGREVKILLSQDTITSAQKLVQEKQSDNQIAVLEAQGAEVTRDDPEELIVYASSLAEADTKYQFHDGETSEVSDNANVLLQGNKLVVLRVDGVKEVFATADFDTQENED